MMLVASIRFYPKPWKRWLVLIAVAVLWHMGLLVIPWEGLLLVKKLTPPTPVHTVDQAQVEKIRTQWREREKSLLLKKNQTPSAEAPKNARYFSNQNIRVEKEQRARHSEVIPKVGTPGEGSLTTPAPPQSQQQKLGATGKKNALSRFAPPLDLTPAKRVGQGGNQGGDQALKDESLPLGSENILNAEQSVYYSYYARLYEAIGPVWQSRIRSLQYDRNIPPGDYIAQVTVVFDPRGNLLRLEFLRHSGIKEFDDAIEYAWKKIGRFPNPPQGLLNGEREVATGWSFSVVVSEGAGFNYAPPRRDY